MDTKATILALHHLSLYNTGRMSPEQIMAAFAARRPLLDRILADIAAEKPKSRAQHHLIVGQRGMGKTMLLARIAAELRKNDAFTAKFIPLVFAEEQYAVDRLSKFWLNCLDSLADAREALKDTESVAEIDATVAKLQSAGLRAVKDDQPFADEVFAAFIKAAQVAGQRPVLLVDNLQLVFERLVPEQQHSLREILMRPGAPVLVGASPCPPPATQDYGAAFYDHFKVHYLRPLEETEMRDLLLHLAAAAQREDVRQRVVQHPARLKVLRQLTGGNPRTTLTLFFLYAEDFAPTVFGDLEGLLDRVTPLYKARFEELAPQQQVVTSAIANHWDPVTAAKLAAMTGLPPTTIGAQLDRLEKTGVIERTELFGETRIGYMLSERFFNIWFLMRSASRRQRREVEFLTRFLENFYEPTDRSRIARHLMCEDRFSPDRYMWSQAVAASLTEPETAEELKRHNELIALREEAREARARLHELIDFSSLPKATLAFDDLRKKLISLVPENAGIDPSEFAKLVLGDRTMFMNGEREQLAARGKLTVEEVASFIEACKKARAADEKTFSVEAVGWFSQRIASGQIRSVRDVEDWNRAFIQANGFGCFKLMTNTIPDGFGAAVSDSNLARIRTFLEPQSPATWYAWNNWGVCLTMKLARHVEAENAYREAIALDSACAMPWSNLGHLLQHHLHRYAEAECACREAIARDSMYAMPWFNLGGLFHNYLHRFQDSENAYLEGINLAPEWAPLWGALGNLYQYNLFRFEAAETAYRVGISRDPRSMVAWNGLGNLYCDFLNRPMDAAIAFNNAIQINPLCEIVLQNRLFLHRDFMGEGKSAMPLMRELQEFQFEQFPDTTSLHESLFAAYDANWGLACDALSKAIAVRVEGFSAGNTDDWLRASAVLLHLNYGAELLAFLDQLGDTTARLRPWVEALRALHAGDRRALQNIAPEIRTTAEIFYDGIEMRLSKLPEKTRRFQRAKNDARTRRKR